MRENMPGTHGWVDRGPRVENTLDTHTNDLGLFYHPRYGWQEVKRYRQRGTTSRLEGYERAPRTPREEAYLEALSDVVGQVTGTLPPNMQRRLAELMAGKSTREVAKKADVSHQAVAQARHRALDKFAQALGAKDRTDKKAVRRGLIARTNFPLADFLPGFVESEA